VPELSEAQRRELAALRHAYEAELPDKLSTIVRMAAAAGRGNWDPAAVKELYLLVHRLAGSAAVWGYVGVSQTAGQLEEIMLSAMARTQPAADVLSAAVPRLVNELKQALPPGQQ
jgi:HPt (histidine-containing phosphotransfer) domain-containing protein